MSCHAHTDACNWVQDMAATTHPPPSRTHSACRASITTWQGQRWQLWAALLLAHLLCTSTTSTTITGMTEPEEQS